MQGGAMSSAAAGEAAAYAVAMKQSPLQHQPQPSAGVHLAYTHDGTAFFKHNTPPPPPPSAYQPQPISSAPQPPPMGRNGALSAAAAISASADAPKRKRGRPRKYGPTTPLAVVPPSEPAAAPTLPPGFTSSFGSGDAVSPQQVQPPPLISEGGVQLAKKRGRPPGSANKKPRPVGTAGYSAAGSGDTGLKPSVVTVQAGEDVASKIMPFCQNGWAVCILSANGCVSTLTLRQAASSSATVTYEGLFEILSLSGTYLVSENDSLSSQTGELSISLASPDGRVLGGVVVGPLTAASPVQVVIGSFLANGKKKPKQPVLTGTPGASSGSSGGSGSPPNQTAAGSFNTSSQPLLSNFSWK